MDLDISKDRRPLSRYEDRLQYLQVERISTLVRKYNWELLPHQHGDLIQIAILKSGAGTVHLDIETGEIGPRSAVVLPQKVMHHFELSKSADLRMMTVEATYFLSNLRQVSTPAAEAALLHPLIIRFEPGDKGWEALCSSFENIEQHQHISKPHARWAVLTANLVATISLLSDHLPHGMSSEENRNQVKLYLSFRDRLEQTFAQQYSISQYAAVLCVTEQSLYRACKAISGQSPSKLVQQRLVLEAQRLLLFSEQPVAHIAYALGFNDPSTFSRFFSDRVGQSPAEFRRVRMG